jgi:hypothetical protein
MQTQQIILDRTKARALWRDYKKHQHWSAPIDREVMHAYQAIAQGKVVIKALESITAAGLNEAGLPKLAIARANAPHCWLAAYRDGSAHFAWTQRGLWSRAKSQCVAFPAGSFPGIRMDNVGLRPRAVVPQVPLPLRPKRGLANYHILWEADWEHVPVDPMLLRRVGAGDLWVVCAAWDLTDIERAALAARVSA